MTILIYFLTIVFGIVCFVIMKKKRYKVMPLICLIMFICFIGFGIISLVYSFVPYGEIFVMPLGSIVFGLISILVGVNDLYSLLCCRKKVDGVYCGYNTYYGGNGISTQAPVFEYTYNGTYYREQTTQNISHKRLNSSCLCYWGDSIYLVGKLSCKTHIYTHKAVSLRSDCLKNA